MDTIVIGEGVELDVRPASAISRLLAALIDLALLGAILLGVSILLANVASANPSEAALEVGGTLTVAFVLVILPTTVDTLTRGRSLGKRAVGIRVVRDDGGPLLFRQALVRALVGVVELWLTLGSVAFICSMVHPQGKRVGDVLAGTHAVRARAGEPATMPVVMPPHLAGWAHSADVARLPDGLALSTRQFLGRAPRLHAASRVELGTRLTTQVQRHVRPLPPPGTHPEAFLAAVIAERAARELAAEQRASVRRSQEASRLRRLPHGIPDPSN